jgi:diadenosine tetraphosphate (Ap4A) HIT family hydrolase
MGDATSECPFCDLDMNRVLESFTLSLSHFFSNEYALSFLDGFPVTELHTLVIPKRHVATYFDLSNEERESIHELLNANRAKIQGKDSTVEGFNIGWNCGEVAGQTIFHAHVHLIPRRKNDVENPRGGVRHLIPGKGNYGAMLD